MTEPLSFTFKATDIDAIATATGRIAVFIDTEGKLDAGARRVNRLSKGAVQRLLDAGEIAKMKAGDVISLAYPAGLAAKAVDVVCLPRRPDVATARKAGAALSARQGDSDVLLLLANNSRAAEVTLGAALRAYEFDAHMTKKADLRGAVTVMASKADEVEAEAKPLLAMAEGVFFTRDLVNEPANVLTTTDFADRLAAMKDIGLKVEVLEEKDLEKLGMGALLSVGHGSISPSKVVVMEWNGGEKGDAPLALVGKGVVFDTGGISLKPAAGMEDMTMDMGGAGVVSGVMKSLALRGAKANVVGLVGIVENMPSDRATRPGDVITSMKGDTIEVINTDAEGRLVLADVMWYAQERFKPCGMIDLATLTGAVIVGLGHENAGVFSNDDDLCKRFLKAADAEGEGAWRMPLGEAYNSLIKSRVADVSNSGGRPAGSITAAMFLQRFVKDDMPWIHLDIAGVASIKSGTTFSPKGATGWGVLALNRMISDMIEA